MDFGYPQVINSMVALGRRVGETQRSWKHTGTMYHSRSAGHAESGVRIEREKVRTLMCYIRELHRVTVERTRFTTVVREMCSSNNQQISPWNRWNDRLSQSSWSLKSPTPIRPLVGKGVLPGVVQERRPSRSEVARGDFPRDQTNLR